jgi:hypothetical protein
VPRITAQVHRRWISIGFRTDKTGKLVGTTGWKKKNAGRNPTQLAENKMVGTRRLELLTSTVSKTRSDS